MTAGFTFSRFCCRCLRWVRKDSGEWSNSVTGEWICPHCTREGEQ